MTKEKFKFSVYAVQIFQADAWKTTYISSFYSDAEMTLGTIETLFKGPIRIAQFVVNDLEFIATHSRDFKVLDKINF